MGKSIFVLVILLFIYLYPFEF